jgi:hypothetical protein
MDHHHFHTYHRHAFMVFERSDHLFHPKSESKLFCFFQVAMVSQDFAMFLQNFPQLNFHLKAGTG